MGNSNEKIKRQPGAVKGYKRLGVEKAPMGFAIPLTVARRLEAFGIRGPVCRAITERFIAVLEFDRHSSSNNHLISGLNGAVIYSTEIGDNIHHITIKKGQDILTVELTSPDLAHYILKLTDILNAEVKAKSLTT